MFATEKLFEAEANETVDQYHNRELSHGVDVSEPENAYIYRLKKLFRPLWTCFRYLIWFIHTVLSGAVQWCCAVVVLGSGAGQCMCSAAECSIVEWCMQWCGVVQWSSAVCTCSAVVHTVVCGAVQWCWAVPV